MINPFKRGCILKVRELHSAMPRYARSPKHQRLPVRSHKGIIFHKFLGLKHQGLPGHSHTGNVIHRPLGLKHRGLPVPSYTAIVVHRTPSQLDLSCSLVLSLQLSHLPGNSVGITASGHLHSPSIGSRETIGLCLWDGSQLIN